jgi:hypothetical protein
MRWNATDHFTGLHFSDHNGASHDNRTFADAFIVNNARLHMHAGEPFNDNISCGRNSRINLNRF